MDNELLKSWCDMEDFDEYLESKNGYSEGLPEREFNALLDEYYSSVKQRIKFCEGILRARKDPLIYYTLAELSNRLDPDESPANLYKRGVRYYCLKAVHLDRNCASAWSLLAYAYSFIAFLGGDTGDEAISIKIVTGKGMWEKDNIVHGAGILSDSQRIKIRCIERAIYCVNKALKIDPDNECYKAHLKSYYHQRKEEFKPEEVPRRLTI